MNVLVKYYHTEEDYCTEGSTLVDPVIFVSGEHQGLIDLDVENFVVGLEGSVSLGELDRKLAESNQITNIVAPENYSLSRILSENWNNQCKKACLGLQINSFDEEGRLIQTKTGGRVIKNVSGFDLAKIYIGSYNSLGVISGAFLRTEKLPESKAEISFALKHYPEDISIFDFAWDNYQVQILHEEAQLILKITLWGDEDLVGLRKAKLQKNLAKYPELRELDLKIGKYSKEYSSIENRIELYSKPSALGNFFAELTAEFANGSKIIAYPNLGRLDISFDNQDFCEQAFRNMRAFLFENSYYAHVYPISFSNKGFERLLNLHSNAYEEELYKKLQEAYHSNTILNPDILYSQDKSLLGGSQ